MCNSMQVTGHLIEDGKTVSNFEISGCWDQELAVKKPNGKREVLWKYKEPKYLDSRYAASHSLLQPLTKYL